MRGNRIVFPVTENKLENNGDSYAVQTESALSGGAK
jgi:hypothetical protein